MKTHVVRRLVRLIDLRRRDPRADRSADPGDVLDGTSEDCAVGSVSLVGAGPGDPELLTLKAVRAIAAADVVLVDDLVNPAVLAHASPAARIVHVGKRGGCKSTPQAFIERLMIAEAREGMKVVRLKGGDPFIFGRGGEEQTHLLEAGIPVEVVHGISSGLAAPGSLGIPLTHRDCSHGVIFVTGHRQRGEPEGAPASGPLHDVDWAALAATGLTLVIYMGIARSQPIADALLAGGMSAATPAAVVQSACTGAQRHLVTTLGRLAADIAASAIGSPAIIVVGDVVRYAQDARLSQFADPAPERAGHLDRTREALSDIL